jgi:hypothetical protein
MKENDNYTRELLTFDLIKANLYGMLFNFNHLSHSYYFIWQDSINKKNLKDLLIYYKDNGYLNPFWLVLLY